MNYGFSIVEAIVIVAIIGILATLGYSRYIYHIAKSRQAEAKNNLNHLVSLQEVYLMEHGEYYYFGYKKTPTVTDPSPQTIGIGLRRNESPAERACSTSKPGKEMLNELGFRPSNCNELRYEYWSPNKAIVTANPPGFNMRADSNPAMTEVYVWPDCKNKDAWRVLDSNSPNKDNRIPHQHHFPNRQVLKACK